jgi:hypothetical protein
MLKYLLRYLTITGSVAAIVLLAPDLVVVGFFLLIVPGALLVATPTAFLWGLVLTGCWLLSRRVLGDTWIAMLVAAFSAALVLISCTLPTRKAGITLFRASLLPETTPAKRIEMRGDVRIDLPENFLGRDKPDGLANERGFACDRICLALLFMPSVKSVTMNRSSGDMAHSPQGGEGLDVNSRTYKLAPIAPCPSDGPRLDLDRGAGLYPLTDAEWAARLHEVCVVHTDNPGHHDILIREGSSYSSNWRERWSLAPRGPVIKFLEIRDGDGRSLLRRFQSSVLALAQPLYIAFAGSEPRFEWGTSEISNRSGRYETHLVAELAAHTDILGRVRGVEPCRKDHCQ